MIDSDREGVGQRGVPARVVRSHGTRWLSSLLGPDETAVLVRFVPYAPEVDLKPRSPGWPVPAIVVAGMLCGLLLVLPAVWVLNAMARTTASQIQAVRQEVVHRQVLARRYAEARSEAATLRARRDALDFLAEGGPRWSTVLDELRANVPPGIRFTSLRGTGSGRIWISGQARNLEVLGSFIVYLRASGDFQKARLIETEHAPGSCCASKTTVQGGAKPSYFFRLVVERRTAPLFPGDATSGIASEAAPLTGHPKTSKQPDVHASAKQQADG